MTILTTTTWRRAVPLAKRAPDLTDEECANVKRALTFLRIRQGGMRQLAAEEVVFHALPHLQTRDVADVLERTCKRIAKWLRRRGLLLEDASGGDDSADDGVAALAASAASGQSPPAGPEWRRGALPLVHTGLRFDKPLCASLDGFTLHAATRAGALDAQGREALLKYDPGKSPTGDILRPPIAQERVTHGPEGLVRITLKKPFADGTVAVDMDPLSLLCRLAASVPAPRFNTVRYAGVLAANAKLRPRIVPKAEGESKTDEAPSNEKPQHAQRADGGRYRSWPELLKRTFLVDVLECDKCHGRMKLAAMITEDKSIVRFLKKLGEPTEPPPRLPARGPPYWKSRALRRMSNDLAVA